MKKFKLLLLLGIAGVGSATAQNRCGTDEVNNKYKELYPEIAVYEQQLNGEIAAKVKRIDFGSLGRRTAGDSIYHIPVVVHVMHDYGIELLQDDKIYRLIAEMNKFYSAKSDTSGVISPYKKYVGDAKIKFHLATKDPNGNPTKGITHHFTYLTYGGDDQAKMDQWPPSNYINIWFENVIGNAARTGIIVAYATPPSTAAVAPFRDGVISNYSFINDGGTTGGSIDHEVGHILNLAHTFGNTNDPGTDCGDDNVDDTPPTQGSLGGCAIYDTICARNYFKLYPDVNGRDSLANYPDTVNEQNIMNYADCKVMFTKGQVGRMHDALNSTVGNRNILWSPMNLDATGVLEPSRDLAPNPEFAVRGGTVATGTVFNYFTAPGNPLKFVNHSWGDTVTGVTWSFTNGASPATSTATTNVLTSFTEPGWVNVTMSATGNNSGTNTVTTQRAVFVADNVAKSPSEFYQDFSNADTAKWPIFNYYNNEFRWKMADVGFFDNNSIMYTGYDYRIYPNTGSPRGDFDDFFSSPVDLSSFSGGACNLNFFYSGASRSSTSSDLNDKLEIFYSKDRGVTWVLVDTMRKGTLTNKGAFAFPYSPLGAGDWAAKTISLPTAARTNYTLFRFRYRPNVGSDGMYSSGNNFFMDRIHVASTPAEVSAVNMTNVNIAVVPNPTSGDAFVVVRDAQATTAQVIVSDVTGKAVYTTEQQLTGGETHIAIPHAAISVKGIYLVQTITGTQVKTLKLVVN